MAIDASEKIAKVIAPSSPTLGYEDILGIVRQVLLQVGDHDWYNDDLHRWSGFTTCIALGFFDNEDGAAALFPDELGKKTRFPNGSKVQIRAVCDPDGGGFGAVVGEEEADICTHCTSWDRNNPNFFVSEGCYHYLQAWIDMRNLPSPNSSQTPGLGFAGELYEIVNSRKELRDPHHGLLPCINYAGLEHSCEQYQEEFPPGQDFVNIARGIAKGLRGRDLLTDVMLDFNTWKFVRPDIWPSPPNPNGSEEAQFEAPTFRAFSPATDSRGSFFAKLSSEELLMICSECTLTSFLSLATTSKSLYSRLAAPMFLDRVIKMMMARGSLRWIMPVESMQGEIERAVGAAKNWLCYSQVISRIKEREAEHASLPKEAHSDKNTVQSGIGNTQYVSTEGDDGEDTSERNEQEEHGPTDRNITVFQSHDFPAFAFVHACYAWNPMRNRERIWGQVKQFEDLWKDFRLEGWEVNRFQLQNA